MQVRKKDDGKIYAMKVLRKDTIVARKQVAHTKAEKNVSFLLLFSLSFPPIPLFPTTFSLVLIISINLVSIGLVNLFDHHQVQKN